MPVGKKLGGALAALAALAVPLTLGAAAPAMASTTPDDDPRWMNAVFTYDRELGNWAGPQTLVYFELSEERPAAVLNPTDNPDAFPVDVCGSISVQVDTIELLDGADKPIVGNDYVADFTQPHGWNEVAWNNFIVEDEPALDELCAPATPVKPAAPTPSDVCEPADGGPTQDYVTIPETEGVEYQIDGKTVTGQIPADGTSVTVTAVPQKGYELTGDTTWTFDFSKEQCATIVTTAPVTSSDVCEPNDGGPTQDTITIPETEGVDYEIDGKTVTGQIPADGTSVTVKAVAQDGYEITGTTEWNLTFTKVECPKVVSPGTVTTTDVCEPLERSTTQDTITIPTTEGVDYQIDGTTVTGTIPAEGTSITVKAVAQDGYELTGRTEWHFTFTKDQCPPEVVSGEVTTADVCEPGDGTTNDTITIPAIPGIEFAIDGTVVEAGDHAATGTTHVVTAKAVPGFTVTGPGEWTFEFTKAACEAGVTPPAPSTTPAPVTAGPDELATTGADDVMPLGLAAIALLTLGAGLVAARRMRGANS